MYLTRHGIFKLMLKSQPRSFFVTAIHACVPQLLKGTTNNIALHHLNHYHAKFRKINMKSKLCNVWKRVQDTSLHHNTRTMLAFHHLILNLYWGLSLLLPFLQAFSIGMNLDIGLSPALKFCTFSFQLSNIFFFYKWIKAYIFVFIPFVWRAVDYISPRSIML